MFGVKASSVVVGLHVRVKASSIVVGLHVRG